LKTKLRSWMKALVEGLINRQTIKYRKKTCTAFPVPVTRTLLKHLRSLFLKTQVRNNAPKRTFWNVNRGRNPTSSNPAFDGKSGNKNSVKINIRQYLASLVIVRGAKTRYMIIIGKKIIVKRTSPSISFDIVSSMLNLESYLERNLRSIAESGAKYPLHSP
jgi:hypothetical protein